MIIVVCLKVKLQPLTHPNHHHSKVCAYRLLMLSEKKMKQEINTNILFAQKLSFLW